MVRFFFTAVLLMLVFTFNEALGNVMVNVKYTYIVHAFLCMHVRKASELKVHYRK